jgi:hypothetical protein
LLDWRRVRNLRVREHLARWLMDEVLAGTIHILRMVFLGGAKTSGTSLTTKIGFKIDEVSIEETDVISSYNTKFYSAFRTILIFTGIESVVKGTSTFKELLFVSTCIIS